MNAHEQLEDLVTHHVSKYNVVDKDLISIPVPYKIAEALLADFNKLTKVNILTKLIVEKYKGEHTD